METNSKVSAAIATIMSIFAALCATGIFEHGV